MKIFSHVGAHIAIIFTNYLATRDSLLRSNRQTKNKITPPHCTYVHGKNLRFRINENIRQKQEGRGENHDFYLAR